MLTSPSEFRVLWSYRHLPAYITWYCILISLSRWVLTWRTYLACLTCRPQSHSAKISTAPTLSISGQWQMPYAEALHQKNRSKSQRSLRYFSWRTASSIQDQRLTNWFSITSMCSTASRRRDAWIYTFIAMCYANCPQTSSLWYSLTLKTPSYTWRIIATCSRKS